MFLLVPSKLAIPFQTAFWGLLFLCLHSALHAVSQDNPLVNALVKTLNSNNDESRRLEALQQLEKAGALTAVHITRSITDISPKIRAESLRIGKSLAAQDPDLMVRLMALANDRSPTVKIEAIPFLLSINHPKSRALFLQVFKAEADNPTIWPIAIPKLGDDLLPSVESLASSDAWKKESPRRTEFYEIAANHLREAGSKTNVEQLLQFLATAQSPPRWTRTALLRGLLGQPASKSTELIPVTTTLTFDSIPPCVQSLLDSKDKDIVSLIRNPNSALRWPISP